MGLLTRLKAAALFGCLLFSIQSFAGDYFWTDGYTTNSSASGFCNAVGASQYPGDPRFTRAQVTMQGDSRVMCAFYFQFASSSQEQFSYSYAYANRGGDGCYGGKTYDPVLAMCVAAEEPLEPGDLCKDQTGHGTGDPMIFDATLNKCVKFTEAKGDAPCTYMASSGGGGIAYTVAGTLDKGGNAVAPPSFADTSISCQVQTISSSECTLNVAGAISCNVIGKLTGKANATGTVDAADAACPDGKCPVKEPETKTTDSGCSPTGTGSGGSTCDQTKETTQDGTQQCGTVNGAYQCFTKPPYSNGITTKITANSETLPDGSVKVTTVKESTNTVCTDVKTCTVKTSTTTTHSTTKPNGTTTTDSSCKGTCTPTGGGLETTPNAGTGNGNGTGNGGNGNCTGPDCGQGEGTADTTDSCTAPPPCAGDPFSCAILKQAHIDTCKLMAPPTAEQQAAADARTNAAFAALDAHQSAMDSKVNTLLGEFQSSTPGGGSGSGKCLPDFNFSVMGMSQSMEFSKVCDSISWVRLMVLAGAYLFAARIVYKEV